MTITSAPWGSTQSGEAVTLFTLSNGSIKTQITNYGGIIVSLETPDKAGKLADIVLGKDNLAAYEAGHPFFGTITGRYANRIAGAKFTLDGVDYTINTGGKAKHTLHGGRPASTKKCGRLKRSPKTTKWVSSCATPAPMARKATPVS